MLIDFEVFETAEIIEFLESEENLKERVVEAEELIQQGAADQNWSATSSDFIIKFILYALSLIIKLETFKIFDIIIL